MKKIHIIFMIFILIVSSVSCSQTAPQKTLDDDIIIYSSTLGGRLIQYNISCQTATVACPDSKCSHNDNCLATNIYALYVTNDYIVYSRGDLNKSIYCYKLKTGTIEKIMDCQACQIPIIFRNQIYFSAATTSYDTTGTLKARAWHIYKYSIEKNTLIKLTQEPLTCMYGAMPIEIKEDAILWCDEQTYYYTDLNYNQRVDTDYQMIIGEYCYNIQTILQQNGSYHFDFHRTDLNTEVTEKIAHGVYSYRLDNPIEPHGLVFNTFHDNSNGNRIYYLDFETLQTEILYDVPKQYTDVNLHTSQGAKQYANDYIGIYIKKKNLIQQESLAVEETMLFINLKTKEATIITP